MHTTSKEGGKEGKAWGRRRQGNAQVTTRQLGGAHGVDSSDKHRTSTLAGRRLRVCRASARLQGADKERGEEGQGKKAGCGETERNGMCQDGQALCLGDRASAFALYACMHVCVRVPHHRTREQRELTKGRGADAALLKASHNMNARRGKPKTKAKSKIKRGKQARGDWVSL